MNQPKSYLHGDVHEARDGESAVERLVVGVHNVNVNGARVALVELPSNGVGLVLDPSRPRNETFSPQSRVYRAYSDPLTRSWSRWGQGW